MGVGGHVAIGIVRVRLSSLASIPRWMEALCRHWGRQGQPASCVSLLLLTGQWIHRSAMISMILRDLLIHCPKARSWIQDQSLHHWQTRFP